MRICSLKEVSHIAQQQAAALMVVGFAEHWPAAWPDLDSAMRTVDEALSDNRICRAAVDDDGEVVGWAAAEPLYNGNVWELTALVVNPSRQRQGIGRFWWRIWRSGCGNGVG